MSIVIASLLAGLDNALLAAALGSLPMARRRRLALAAGFLVCESLFPLLGLLLAFDQPDVWAEILSFGLGAGLLLWLLATICWRKHLRGLATRPGAWVLLLPPLMAIDNLFLGASSALANWTACLVAGLLAATVCLIGLTVVSWGTATLTSGWRQLAALTMLASLTVLSSVELWSWL